MSRPELVGLEHLLDEAKILRHTMQQDLQAIRQARINKSK